MPEYTAQFEVANVGRPEGDRNLVRGVRGPLFIRVEPALAPVGDKEEGVVDSLKNNKPLVVRTLLKRD
jgi:hypothetical protein